MDGVRLVTDWASDDEDGDQSVMDPLDDAVAVQLGSDFASGTGDAGRLAIDLALDAVDAVQVAIDPSDEGVIQLVADLASDDALAVQVAIDP